MGESARGRKVKRARMMGRAQFIKKKKKKKKKKRKKKI